MEIHCTRPLQPNEAPHQNSISDRFLQADPHDEAVRAQLQACRCSVCHMPLVLGQARYVPIQEIGQGGFGRAFLALDREFQNSKLVLKQLRSQFLSEGVIHRDVKPSNIIYRDRDRSYHLIDFGAARVLQSDRTSDQTHSAFRSAGFSAPEVERGDAYVQSDLYSLAATCVNLLTGTNPIQAQIPHRLDYWHRQVDIGSRLVKILNRMLHPDYRQRYGSASDVLAALNAPRSLVWQQLFAGGLLGGLGILGWKIWQPPDLTNQPISIDRLPTYLSRGEESLVGNGDFPDGSPCQQAFVAKQAGITAFAKTDRQTAAKFFKQSLQHFDRARQIDRRTKRTASTCATDPETVDLLRK